MYLILFTAHRGMLPCFYVLSEGKCCFASDIRDHFEQELPFEKCYLYKTIRYVYPKAKHAK